MSSSSPLVNLLGPVLNMFFCRLLVVLLQVLFTLLSEAGSCLGSMVVSCWALAVPLSPVSECPVAWARSRHLCPPPAYPVSTSCPPAVLWLRRRTLCPPLVFLVPFVPGLRALRPPFVFAVCCCCPVTVATLTPTYPPFALMSSCCPPWPGCAREPCVLLLPPCPLGRAHRCCAFLLHLVRALSRPCADLFIGLCCSGEL